MPHIHTEPGQHDLTASAFIIRTDFDEPKLLLHVHKKHAKLMQPGGHVELHENPWQAIQHEIEEETGYDMRQLKVLQPEWAISKLTGAEILPTGFCVNTHQIGDTNHYHTDIAYVFTSDSAPNGVPGEDESNDLRWLTCDEIKALTSEEIAINVQEISLKVFEVCVGKWSARNI